MLKGKLLFWRQEGLTPGVGFLLSALVPPILFLFMVHWVKEPGSDIPSWSKNLPEVTSFAVSYFALWVLYLGQVLQLRGVQDHCVSSAEEELNNDEKRLSCQVREHPLIRVKGTLEEYQKKNEREADRPSLSFFMNVCGAARMVVYPKIKHPLWDFPTADVHLYIARRPAFLLPLYYGWYLLRGGCGSDLSSTPRFTLEHKTLPHPDTLCIEEPR